MAFELRITDAGRAALADGTNRGTNAIRLTKMAIGDGSGPGGAADDGRTALRDQKMVVALGGSTMVSGRIAVKGEFQPTEAWDVTELGLLGRVGNGAEELYAYWTHATDTLASTLAGTRLVIAGSLDIQPAAAEVTVNVDASISLGDPALSGSVTALGGRVDTAEDDITALEGRVDTAETDIDALENAPAAASAAALAALAARVAALEAGGDSVIESIQRGVFTIPDSPGASQTITITSVDMSKTMTNLLTTFGRSGGSSQERVTVILRLASATTMEISSTSGLHTLSNKTFSYEVIEFA